MNFWGCRYHLLSSFLSMQQGFGASSALLHHLLYAFIHLSVLLQRLYSFQKAKKPAAAMALLMKNCSNHQRLPSCGSAIKPMRAIPNIAHRSKIRHALIVDCLVLLASIVGSFIGVVDSVALEYLLYTLRGKPSLCGHLYGALVP